MMCIDENSEGFGLINHSFEVRKFRDSFKYKVYGMSNTKCPKYVRSF